MNTSDWVAGFALAAFLALPFGAVVSLFVSLSEKPREFDINAPLISSRDVRRCAVAAIIFVVIFTPVMAQLAKKDRLEAESWQNYTRDHKCIVVDSRTRMQSQFNPATKTTQITTTTEYLWRCAEGDEHWHPY